MNDNSFGKNICVTYGISPNGASIRFIFRENKIPSISLVLGFNDKLPHKFVNHIVYLSCHVMRYTSPSV